MFLLVLTLTRFRSGFLGMFLIIHGMNARIGWNTISTIKRLVRKSTK